jgi:enoyl-CoA hydratase/carnithine racemase
VLLDITDDGRVRTILLDRTERLNAFDGGLVTALHDALVDADRDPEVAVVVLSGKGRAFSSGADLKALAAAIGSGPPAGERPAGRSTFDLLVDVLADLSKPIVMAVNGVAAGFGMTMLAFADLVIMSSEARLRCPFTELGAPPEAASTFMLPQLLGRQHAAWVLLSSEWITADEAHEMGLAWKLCPPEDVLVTAQEHAQVLAARPVAALTMVKRLVNASHRDQIAAATAREQVAMAEMLAGLGSVDRSAMAALVGEPDPPRI